MEAYKVGALGDSDEDAKKIKEAERDVVHQLSREKKKPNREGRPPPPMFHQWVPAMPQPQQMLLPQQAPPHDTRDPTNRQGPASTVTRWDTSGLIAQSRQGLSIL